MGGVCRIFAIFWQPITGCQLAWKAALICFTAAPQTANQMPRSRPYIFGQFGVQTPAMGAFNGIRLLHIPYYYY